MYSIDGRNSGRQGYGGSSRQGRGGIELLKNQSASQIISMIMLLL